MQPMIPADASRRTFLAGGAALMGALIAGCGGSSDDDGGSDGNADAGSTTSTTAAPETGTAAGHALRLGIQVVDADCAPMPGAVVDVWHADSGGDYSAFRDGSSGDEAGEGTTFLRGSQVADGDGIVEFATVYPGWYPGRAVHIHTKVRLDDSAVLTTQLYFDDDLTDEVHAEDPYAAHGSRDTRNEDDSIAGDPAANGNQLTASAAAQGTLGLVVLGVDPDA